MDVMILSPSKEPSKNEPDIIGSPLIGTCASKYLLQHSTETVNIRDLVVVNGNWISEKVEFRFYGL